MKHNAGCFHIMAKNLSPNPHKHTVQEGKQKKRSYLRVRMDFVPCWWHVSLRWWLRCHHPRWMLLQLWCSVNENHSPKMSLRREYLGIYGNSGFSTFWGGVTFTLLDHGPPLEISLNCDPLDISHSHMHTQSKWTSAFLYYVGGSWPLISFHSILFH